MSCYTTVNTTYDGPPPLGYSPPDLITVAVSANVGGFFVSRTVTLQGDTTISSLIEAILKIQDNNAFPTSIARLGPPNAIGAPITSITPRVWKTTYSYKTIDVIVTDAPTSWTPPPTNAQSDSDRPTLFSFNYLNIHDPFCKIWTRLTRPADDYLVKLDQASPSLQYHKMQLTLNRTLRVPNDLCTHLMPASMGSLQIVSVTKFADKLPDCIRSKGGLLVPMYHQEAMWLEFQGVGGSHAYTPKVAVRTYVGGVNTITGKPSLSMQRILGGHPHYVADGLDQPQDYVVIPGQTRLDGIMTGDGEVRQFVATPLDQSMTIEAQLTGKDMLGGLQVELIPSFDIQFSIGYPHQHWGPLSTPSESGMEVGAFVQLHGLLNKDVREVDYTIADYQAIFGLDGPHVTLRIVSEVIYLKEESGEILSVAIKEPKGMTISQLRAHIRAQLGEKYDFRPLYYHEMRLFDYVMLDDYDITFESMLCLFSFYEPRFMGFTDTPCSGLSYAKLSCSRKMCLTSVLSDIRRMGIGAGAKIRQTIHRDWSDRRTWDLEASSVVNIQILNALDFARITNMHPHPSPITRDTYINMRLPWFDALDASAQMLQNIDSSARFKNLVTILPEPQSTNVTTTSVLLLALGQAISERRNVVTLRRGGYNETQDADTQSDLLACNIS